jgi:uncharacterized protein YodC (DUF2158 family)
MTDFKIGDTVRLKSGGPLMTISGKGTDNAGYNSDDYKLCEWFDNNTPKIKNFHKESIELDSDDFPGL